MKPVVYIHTNRQQYLGALVSRYSMRAMSKHSDKFDVKILCLEDLPYLYSQNGKKYLRKGRMATWLNSDLQSFSPLRMCIPQIMNYSGRALVVDPDVFAVGDVWELLNKDLGGKAICCRIIRNGYKNNGNSFCATSVMLLDCSKLSHWKWNDSLDLLFSGRLDYGDWISLAFEDPKLISELSEEWNHFDILNTNTKLLHNTERITQPWKTGLKIDFDTTTRKSGIFENIRNIFKFDVERYQQHPDLNQERYFLQLLKSAIQIRDISEDDVRMFIRDKNIRSDIFNKLEELDNA